MGGYNVDTLYIGDIPSDYHYFVVGTNYIRLFNKSFGRNESLKYYQIYTNTEEFLYTEGSQTFSNNTITYFTDVNVSSNWMYRKDIDKIFTVVFIIVLMFLFCFNIITSCIKKGGIFSGLI